MVATVDRKTTDRKTAEKTAAGTGQNTAGETQTVAERKAAEQQAKKKAAIEKATMQKEAAAEMATSSAKKSAGTSMAKTSNGSTSAVKSPSEKPAKGKGRKGKRNRAKEKIASLIEQNSTLMSTLEQIEKQFGEGSIMPLGSDKRGRVAGVATGSLSLDLALGGQGIPRGRVVEVFGPESSGKTTLALHVAAQGQKGGGIAAIIDAEHAFDPSWGKKLGVDLDTLLVSQPSSGEEALQIVEMLVKSNAVDVIIVDSVAALVPRKELEGEIGDSHVGLQARLMSQAMRKLTEPIAKSKSVVIFINQIREKIGVMFGSPETTPGGRALKFYSSCRIDVRRIAQLKDGEQVIGQRVRAKVVKNKVAPPFRVAEFDMMHANGISYEGDLLDLGLIGKVVGRSGAWYKYGEDYLGQGKEKARQHLVENPELAAEIHAKIVEAMSEVEDGDAEGGNEST
ncbi:MAG: recombinase RecA [Pirellulaceae bacterium]